MKHLFVSISVKQNLFLSVVVHKCLMILNDVEAGSHDSIFGFDFFSGIVSADRNVDSRQ